MALKFFTVPIQDSTAESELNAFLRSHRVLSVDRRWVEQGPSSFWAICVDHLDAAHSKSSPSHDGRARKPKVDYRDVLSPEDFNLYARLREWRKEAAAADGVPVYAVFTNEQLAHIVKKRATSRAALAQIEGVGEARVTKYGPAVLELLRQHGGGTDEAGREPVGTNHRPGEPAAGLS